MATEDVWLLACCKKMSALRSVVTITQHEAFGADCARVACGAQAAVNARKRYKNRRAGRP